MVKKDRAAEIAKQSKKKPDELKNPKSKQQQFEETMGKIEREKEDKRNSEQQAVLAARAEQEEGRAAALKEGRAPIGGAKMGGAQTFAKARKQQKKAEASSSESADSEGEEASPAPSPKGPVAETTKRNKKDKKLPMTINEEWDLIMKQNAKERNERIAQRIKNMLFIGLFEKKDKPTAEGKVPDVDSKKKGGKKKPAVVESKGMADTMRNFKPALYTIGIVLVLIALKIGEEGYNPYMQREEGELNPYTVLDISSSSTQGDIKKAYKDLALQWHPDKNPDCETCEKHFKEIGKAYELLADTERRSAYDNKRTESFVMNSAYSIPLTLENYEKRVLRSNDVWIINLHHSEQGSSNALFAVWEDLAEKGMHYFKFGHIDVAGEGARLLPLLPVRKGLYPTILRIARGFPVEVAPMSDFENSKKLTRWTIDSFPKARLTQLADENAYNEFAAQKLGVNKLGRIVFSIMVDAGNKRNQLAMLRIALTYSSFFEFAMIERENAPRNIIGTHASAAVMMYIDEKGNEHRTSTNSVKDPSDFEIALGEIFHNHAPVIDQMTYHDICGSKHVRKYCLALLDPTSELVAKTLQELKEAKAAHEQEQKELEHTDDFQRIEPPNIQVVSIMTAPSLFSRDFPVGRSFSSWHYKEGILGASQFLLEESTDRARGLDNYGGIPEWYQMLVLEDLTLREVGSIRPHLPDPIPSVQEDLRQVFLGSYLRTLLSFLFAVVIAAVIPEMDKQQGAAFLTIVPAVFMVVSSYVLRKSIALTFV